MKKVMVIFDTYMGKDFEKAVKKNDFTARQ